MAIGNPFKKPGDEEMEKWSKPAWPDSSKTKAPVDSALSSNGGGGYGKAARDTVETRQRAASDKQAQDEPPPEVDNYGTPNQSDPTEKKSEAVLSDPKWTENDTLFQQEAEVSVKVTLPEGKEHLTRVQAELFAKTPNGRESIANAEGHADADGRAALVLPVYKPKGHKEGAVEYFIEFVHKLGKALSTENLLRKVSETALKSDDHVLIPGVTFAKDSSFIGPQAAEGFHKVESKLKEWDAADSKKAKIVVFGHADQDEKNPKALSERRAQSAYAFITNDAATWEKLYSIEKWGLLTLQILLKDLGHYLGTPDGQDGPKTQEAIKAMQNKAGLPATGKEDSATRQALFAAYMKGKHDIQIEVSRFRQVAGNPWMGCAANNHANDENGSAPENRRVAFILIKESKFFPVYFPCQDGSEAACQGQCKKSGKRSTAGIRCAFYDELVREEDQEKSAPSTETTAVKNHDAGYSVEKAVAFLDKNAGEDSQGHCARAVRLAIEAGGGQIKPPNPLSAQDYGPKLAELGFKKMDTDNYIPQQGDIAVFQGPSTSPHGHIQMFNGSIWVSDFRQNKQRDIYPGPKYREEKVSYEVFRP